MKVGDVVYVRYQDNACAAGVYPKQAEDFPMPHLFAYGKVIKIEEQRILIQCYGQDLLTSSPPHSFYLWVLRATIVEEKILIEATATE